jgi:hypothetical protein
MSWNKSNNQKNMHGATIKKSQKYYRLSQIVLTALVREISGGQLPVHTSCFSVYGYITTKNSFYKEAQP